MSRRPKPDENGERDDRPPICPNCGVTQGMVMSDGETRYVCLECGFPDETEPES